MKKVASINGNGLYHITHQTCQKSCKLKLPSKMPTNLYQRSCLSVLGAVILRSQLGNKEKRMNTLGWDIYLDVKLLSFDKSEVTQKGQILLEQAKQLPVKTDSMFIEKVKVPCGGYIQISLMAKHFTRYKIRI